jgi:hypothetical protein
MQQPLIMRVLAEHYAMCPGGANGFAVDQIATKKPLGALIMATQAVRPLFTAEDAE